MATIEVNGKNIEFDGEGFLAESSDWDKEVGLVLAEAEKIVMTEDHWTVVQLMRDYYTEHKVIPTARDFTALMGGALSSEKGSNKYLATLFPGEQLKQCAKVAGLTRMAGCT
jgi:tRNA 2-thiouridine synthesizing protein E